VAADILEKIKCGDCSDFGHFWELVQLSFQVQNEEMYVFLLQLEHHVKTKLLLQKNLRHERSIQHQLDWD
jgi:hypothetical protein